MALLKLTGKYAVGPHSHAIVDDDMLAYLSQWRWKAKPNGNRNNVYAVRNVRVGGRCVTLRMHRVVAGLDASNPLDVDHDNHNSLDNRQVNLVPSTRAQNIGNARPIVQSGNCKHCGVLVRRTTTACAHGCAMVCQACRSSNSKRPRSSAVFFTRCKQCDKNITARRSGREFCDDMCRCRFRAAAGYVQPSRRKALEKGPVTERLAENACSKNERVLVTTSVRGGSEDSRNSPSAEF